MENQPEVTYVSPRESLETEGEPERRIDLVVDGETIGSAVLHYYSKPIRLYQVTDLYVHEAFKGKGYASAIMDRVEYFLQKEVKLPGVLADAIIEGDPAQGMYAKRGWVEVLGSHGLYVFNWPKRVGFDVLVGYSCRYTDMMNRQGFATEN
jgi:GNAT superfamily N-acetyltransferase